jgi:hypothetical protein
MHVVNAAAPIKNIAIFLVVFLVVVAVGSYLDALTRSYEIKTAARTACNQLAAQTRYKREVKWQEEFVRSVRKTGIDLKPGQYDFKMQLTTDQNICSLEVAWKETMPIFLLGDAFGLEPIVFVQRIDQTHAVKATWK